MPDRPLTDEELATALGEKVYTINTWRRRGIIPHLDLGYRTKRYDLECCASCAEGLGSCMAVLVTALRKMPVELSGQFAGMEPMAIYTLWKTRLNNGTCVVENKRRRIRHVNSQNTIIAIIATLSASLSLADDFKTINGKEYKNVTVSRVEADGIVLKSKSGISKVYFSELPPEIQKKYGYEPEAAIQEKAAPGAKLESAAQNANAAAARSGIEGLPPITLELTDEILNALKITDKLDALYRRGCSSAEFISAALPMESAVTKLQYKLPKGDPRRDLLVNASEAYQNAAVAIRGNERGNALERPDATMAVAQIRKRLLIGILQGNMTPEEKKVYFGWRKALETTPQ